MDGVDVEMLRSPEGDGRWSQADAIALCRKIEAVCVPFGCHVALTGGTLYKDGTRKDCDVLFYRIRQAPKIDDEGLFAALASIGVEKTGGFGWCHKATYEGRKIDCFFPEETGEYQSDDEATNTFLADLTEGERNGAASLVGAA